MIMKFPEMLGYSCSRKILHCGIRERGLKLHNSLTELPVMCKKSTFLEALLLNKFVAV